MKKIIVIYHRADFDGIFCREVARKFLGDTAEYIGWDFGDSPVLVPPGIERIYIMDLPVDKVFGTRFDGEPIMEKIIWIDHHKSSIEANPTDIPGYRIDGVAACRLAWQWFSKREKMFHVTGGSFSVNLPTIDEFKNREVSEPLAVRLAGEYDIWDKRDPRAELFQHGLHSRELGPDTWDILLSGPTAPDGDKQGWAELYVDVLLDAGAAIQYNSTQQNESIIKAYGFTVQWEGLTFLACNHARFNSHLFTAGIRPEHDALLGFNYDGSKREWRFSLYGIPGKDIDLSIIAVKYGGGGHRGACGFRSHDLPWTRNDLNTLKLDANGKAAYLFYYEETENCWAPVPKLVEEMVSTDQLSDGETMEIEFKRTDMTPSAFAAIPEN